MGAMDQSGLRLTLPSDEGRSTRAVTGRFLKKLARDVFSLPSDLVGEELLPTHQRVLGDLRGLGKEGVLAIVRRPQVHAFLCCAVSALTARNIPVARIRAQELLFQLTYEMALEGLLQTDIEWQAPFPLNELVSPSRRIRLSLSSELTSLSFSADGISGAGGELDWRDSEYPIISNRFVLALADTNPMSDFEAHPDKDGNQLSLGAASVDDWCKSLSEALGLIETFLPALHREMALIHQQFVPVGTHDEQHLSASYQESIGTVYLTLHPQLMTMTEAVIHEFQHNKINMLFHLDAVMENAFYPLFSSPVRPDPRPLHGVMLAAHAFVPVAELYQRLAKSEHPMSQRRGFDGRFRHIVTSNSAALDVLVEHAKPTRFGQAIIDEMVELNRTHRTFVGELS